MINLFQLTSRQTPLSPHPVHSSRKHRSTNRTTLLGHGLQEDGSKEEIQSGDLNRPRLGVRAVELTVHEHSEQRRHQQRSTAQRVANRESQLRARRRVAPVAERQKERRPNGYS